MSQPMDPDEANKLAKSCVCSDCWGELTVKYDWRARMSTVGCQTPDCPQNGYVSRRYVEKREATSAGELAEARCALTSAGVIKSSKSETQLLSELGF